MFLDMLFLHTHLSLHVTRYAVHTSPECQEFSSTHIISSLRIDLEPPTSTVLPKHTIGHKAATQFIVIDAYTHVWCTTVISIHNTIHNDSHSVYNACLSVWATSLHLPHFPYNFFFFVAHESQKTKQNKNVGEFIYHTGRNMYTHGRLIKVLCGQYA